MTPHRAVHVLRWRYGKDRATLHCELAFDSHALSYEFRTARDEAGAGARVERFVHVMHAFARQSACEAKLIERGWSLLGYQSGAASDTEPPVK
jgi:hypothetical protein